VAVNNYPFFYSIAISQGLGDGPSEVVAKVVEQMADVQLRFADHQQAGRGQAEAYPV